MFYLGLDLGKLRDFSALAIVEREEPAAVRFGWSPVAEAYGGPPQAAAVLRVRHLERAALGTPYTRVVARVAELTRHPRLHGSSHLTVDSTGVGVPVVESLRAAQLGCRGMTAVTITGGERARQAASGFGVGVGEHWHVPRADLLGGLRMLLEKGELKIAKAMRESGTLIRELLSMRSSAASSSSSSVENLHGEHDDLVLAVALACWQASRAKNAMGTQRLIGI